MAIPAVASRVTAGSVATTLANAKRSGTLGTIKPLDSLMQIRQQFIHTCWIANLNGDLVACRRSDAVPMRAFRAVKQTTQTHSTGTTDNNPSPIPCYNSGPTWLDSSCAGQYPHLDGRFRSLSSRILRSGGTQSLLDNRVVIEQYYSGTGYSIGAAVSLYTAPQHLLRRLSTIRSQPTYRGCAHYQYGLIDYACAH